MHASPNTRRPSRRRRAAPAILLLFIAGALALAASQAANAGTADTTSSWRHALAVTADLNANPPDKPVVLLLGGSAAREATVSDADWRADIKARSGMDVVIHNFGSIHQTFAQDRWLIGEFPRIPMIVYLGVNLGRFAGSPNYTWSTDANSYSGSYQQHHYVNIPPLSVAKKRALVDDWLTLRYPNFKDRYAYNVGQLEACIQRSLRRGYHPVIVELPRNLDIIGHAFDVPVARYHRDMRRLADKYHIRWVNYLHLVGLANRDYFDIQHLIESGRPKWQGGLSARTIALIKGYGLAPTPEPTPTTTATPAPAPTSSASAPP